MPERIAHPACPGHKLAQTPIAPSAAGAGLAEASVTVQLTPLPSLGPHPVAKGDLPPLGRPLCLPVALGRLNLGRVSQQMQCLNAIGVPEWRLGDWFPSLSKA
jgi:hypothetical protein